MSSLAIFLIGLFVTALTLTATVLVGVNEAADPDHSRPGDVAKWELSLMPDDQAEAVKRRDRKSTG